MKAKKRQKDGILRMSRLRGSTALGTQYHKTQEPSTLKKLKNMYIEHYALNNGIIDGRVWRLDDFARYINEPIQTVMKEMIRNLNRVGSVLEGKDGANFARALILGLISKTLESQGLIANQVHILTSRQGNRFVPFLSNEVNKILATYNVSTKSTMELLKLVMGDTPAIVNNINQINQNNAQYLTPDIAINLIRSQGYQSLLEDPQALENKLTELNGTQPLPELRAAYQDLNAIGIKNPNKGLDGPRKPKYGPEDNIEVL